VEIVAPQCEQASPRGTKIKTGGASSAPGFDKTTSITQTG